MSRLSKKDITTVIDNELPFLLPRVVGKTLTAKILNEMLEYKDIEEELGIDLITLFKALKNDCIYMKDYCPDRIVKCSVTGITKDSLLVLEEGDYYFEDNTHVEYKDYGKTWALTKEELL